MNVLLVVDLCPRFKEKGRGSHFKRITKFAREAKQNGYDLVYATVCKNTPKSPFFRYNSWIQHVDEIDKLEFNYDALFVKESYGLNQSSNGVSDYSKLNKDYHYDIIGYDTEGCVLKVATDMFDRGFDFSVLTQYCFSSGGRKFHKIGLAVMRRLLGSALHDNR